MSLKVVVVGSGASGSTAALLLAKAGCEVVVVERASVLAPLIRGFRLRDLPCDTGFHYTGCLEEGGYLRHIFQRLGMLDRIEPVPLPRDGFDVLHHGERTIAIATGMADVEDRLTSEFPKSRPALTDYFAATRRLLDATPFINADLPYWAATSLPEDEISLARFLRERGAEESLVAFLGHYGELFYGTDAEETPFRVNATVLGSYFRSAHAVVNGGEGIADAFEDAFRDAGVKARTSARVETIQVDESAGRAVGVRLADGETLTADHVVFSGHPKLLPGLLPPGALRPALRHRLESLEDTPPFFVVFLEVSEAADRLDRNLYRLPNGDPRRPDGGATLALLAGTPTPDGRSRGRALIEEASPSDRTTALAASWPARSEDYRRWKSERAIAALDRAVASGFVPRHGTSVVEALTPASYRDWTGTVGGSAYGPKHTVRTLPLNPRTRVSGLTLAGQGLLLPGIIGATGSGVIAAGHVVGNEAVRGLLGWP